MAVSREKITLHENYLHTFRCLYYFFIKYFFARKSLWFCNFTASSTKWFETRGTRNLSCEVTAAMWINFCIRFTSRMFSCCEYVSQTSRESSVTVLSQPHTKVHLISVMHFPKHLRNHAVNFFVEIFARYFNLNYAVFLITLTVFTTNQKI